MPLIKTTTATATTTAAGAAMQQANATTTATITNGATARTTTTAAATSTATRSSCGKVRTTLVKSVPATPVQPKSPTAHFISTSPECEGGATAAAVRGIHANDDDDHYNNCSEYLPHSYPNFTFDLSEDDSNDYDDDELELDDSSLAMITPPPPYVDTPLQQYARAHVPPLPPLHAARTRRAATAPPPPTRKKLFQNREIFNINTPATITPSSSSFASAITPTKLSAAAAAMFAAPQMAQLNKKWTQLHRKRRRRNSSSGDSKELDKLVLQSVDWDENDIY